MVKDFKSIQDAEHFISYLTETINKLIDIEGNLVTLNLGLSVKGHIDSLEKDLQFCLLQKYKLENKIRW